MSVSGSKKVSMKVYEALWWYMDANDGVWVYMRPYGCICKYMMVFECKW